MVCPLKRFVQRPAGPRCPHLAGFIIWTSRYRPGSFLQRQTHSCHMTNPYLAFAFFLYALGPHWVPRLYKMILGRLLKSGLTSVSSALFPPAELPCTMLGPSGPLLVLKVTSSISRSSSIAWRDCTVILFAARTNGCAVLLHCWKGFSHLRKRSFPHSLLVEAVLVPVSQGTRVSGITLSTFPWQKRNQMFSSQF